MMEPDAPSPSAPFGPPPLDSASSISCGTCCAGIGEGGACCPQDPQAAARDIGLVKIPRRASISKNDALAGEEDEEDELGSSSSRVCEESDKSDGSGGSESEHSTAPDQKMPGQEDMRAGAESLLTADSLASRAFEMFDAGASEPWGSGLPPATPRCAQHTHWPPSSPHPLPHVTHVPRPPARAVP